METRPHELLLAPTDMSDASLPALIYAAELARRAGGRLVLLHVISHREIEEGIAEGRYVDQQLEEARRTLFWWFTRLVPAAARQGVTVETLTRIGHPEHEIVDTARAIQAEIIVMATHGRSGLRRAILGSVAEAVLRHAPCPVLTIPPTALQHRVPAAMRRSMNGQVSTVVG